METERQSNSYVLKLQTLARQQNLTVTYTVVDDDDEKEGVDSIVQVNSQPPLVSGGAGNTKEEAFEVAAKNTLRLLKITFEKDILKVTAPEQDNGKGSDDVEFKRNASDELETKQARDGVPGVEVKRDDGGSPGSSKVSKVIEMLKKSAGLW